MDDIMLEYEESQDLLVGAVPLHGAIALHTAPPRTQAHDEIALAMGDVTRTIAEMRREQRFLTPLMQHQLDFEEKWARKLITADAHHRDQLGDLAISESEFEALRVKTVKNVDELRQGLRREVEALRVHKQQQQAQERGSHSVAGSEHDGFDDDALPLIVGSQIPIINVDSTRGVALVTSVNGVGEEGERKRAREGEREEESACENGEGKGEREKGDVVDLSPRKRKRGEDTQPMKIKIGGQYCVESKMLPYSKGEHQGIFEVISIGRGAKEGGKPFNFNIPTRLLRAVCEAVGKVVDSKKPTPDVPLPTRENVACMKPDADGFVSLESEGNSGYARTQYLIEGISIQLQECVYKTTNGMGSHEGLVFQRSLGAGAKIFNMNVPARLIPQLRVALDYFAYVRG